MAPIGTNPPALTRPKFPRADAIAVARELSSHLSPFAEPGRFIIAGSLRRRKQQVGDVEIVYIPRTTQEPDGLFDTKTVDLFDRRLDFLLKHGVIAKRLNSIGAETWGPQNKLARHWPSGIPVDLFATREASWFSYLVCRTGGEVNNIALAMAAQRKGWKWHPYGAGFTDEHGDLVPVHSEREVFELVGVPYLEPWQR